MTFTHPTQQRLLAALLANGTQTITPPPAYTPDSHPDFKISVTNTELDMDQPYDPDDLESLSEIHFSIKTPLSITGDDNLITTDSSLAASKIAMAVVTALKQVSMSGAGVPMIDEEGRPRPIKIFVNATTTVQGHRNVVGDKVVLGTALAGALKRKTEESGQDSMKRPRAGSEPLEMNSKRARRDCSSTKGA